jgi:Phage tail protein
LQKIIFTNSLGDSLEISESIKSPYLLLALDGIGGADVSNKTQKSPYQDGVTFIDSNIEARFITFETAIFSYQNNSSLDLRRNIASIFNPKLGLGILRYENEDVIKEIQGIVDNGPIFPSGSDNRGGNLFQKARITLFCPSPYWRSLDITEEPTFESLFQFPFEGFFEMGLQRDKRIIDNDGDAPAPIYLEFFGPAVNPIITNNTTGEFIKVNQTLGEGEFMRVDTTPGNKSVEFVSPDGTITNVFNWIDLGSTFFQLIVGENEIEYSADSDIQGAVVNIRYNKLYVGI